MSILDLVRPEILALQGYSSARMEAQGGRVLLNANENPWSGVADSNWNRYPEPQPLELISLLAGLYEVPQTNLLATRGSDEAIDLLVRSFCAAGVGAIIECPPCFGMYRVSAQVQGAQVISVPLTESWQVDQRAVVDAWRPGANIVFVCSPNNPTGTVTSLVGVSDLCEALAGKALVVVDEAYQEFSSHASCTTLLDRHENLAVLRTLSKAYGLAGVRLGSVSGRPELIQTLRKIMAPYPLPSPTVEAVIQSLSAGAKSHRDRVSELIDERSYLARQLDSCDDVLELWAFEANFVLARVSNARDFVRRCRKSGVLIRDVSGYPGLPDCVRITVGTRSENEALIRAAANERLDHVS